jgi:hypothetical protein
VTCPLAVRRGERDFLRLWKTDKDVALALSGWSAYGPADRKARKGIYKPRRRSQQHSRPVKVSLSAQPDLDETDIAKCRRHWVKLFQAQTTPPN